MGENKLFPTTRWTLISSIQSGSQDADCALQELCDLYWEPIYSFVRRRGYNHQEAEDHTQNFFSIALRSELLQRPDDELGRLRTFLLKALSNYLSNHHNHEMTQRRGGKWVKIPFEEATSHLQDMAHYTAEEVFDYQWALGIVRSSANYLRDEYVKEGKESTFLHLRGFLPGTINPPSIAEAATELGITQGGARTAIFRLRTRFRRFVRSEIQRTLSAPDDIDQEIDYLIRLLASKAGELPQDHRDALAKEL